MLASAGPPASLLDLLQAARRVGERLLAEALLVLLRERLTVWEHVQTDARPKLLLRAIETWLGRPDRAHALAVERAANAAGASADASDRFLIRGYMEGAFSMGEHEEIEQVARAAEVAGRIVAALTLSPAARETLELTLARFAVTVARAGLELDDARRLLRESLVPELLAGP